MTRHAAVIGLGFGDEGKGAIIDHLASWGEYGAVVKASGGAQCAHHVVREDGSWIRFAQFGSGTFWGLPTHLSKFFLVQPGALLAEANALAFMGVTDPLKLITVDRRCLVTTPYHAAINRMKELSRENPHGSCGVGIGETMKYALTYGDEAAIRVEDLLDRWELRRKLSRMRNSYRHIWGLESDMVPTEAELIDLYGQFVDGVKIVDGDYISKIIAKDFVIFEGSQGVLLDEWYGFHPHTTWATTTFENPYLLLEEAGHKAPREVLGIGVLRAYTTRHGHGPFPTEDDAMLDTHPEMHNGTGKFQGAWRNGQFDAVLHRYAWQAVKDTFFWHNLAITHLDQPAEKVCTRYEVDGMSVSSLISPEGAQRRGVSSDDLAYQHRMGEILHRVKPVYQDMDYYNGGPRKNIEAALDADCLIESYGPRASDKKLVRVIP